MRILYISGEDIPGDHGGSIHTWYVARGWARLGHRVTVLCRRRQGQPSGEELEGVRIQRVGLAVRGKKIPLLGLSVLPELLRESWDVVVERYDVFGGMGAIMAWLKGLPLLLEVNYPHLDELIWKWEQRRSRFLRVPFFVSGLQWWSRWQFRYAAGTIATRKDIVPESIRERTWLVHWGADPERFRPLDNAIREEMRRQLGIDGNPVVIFLGSFRSWHGTDMLPDLVDTLRQAVPEIRFLLVGDGEGLDTLRVEIKDRGLDAWVRFTGNVPHNEMPDILSCADVGIAPYDANKYQPLIDHGFFWSPAKLFEYAACGLPVVCSRYDLLSDIVEDGVTGRLVPPGNTQAFADAVIDLCRNPWERFQMGDRGRKKVLDRFSWDIHARQVAGILEQLVADGCDRKRG